MILSSKIDLEVNTGAKRGNPAVDNMAFNLLILIVYNRYLNE